jgi:hypothetical protein
MSEQKRMMQSRFPKRVGEDTVAMEDVPSSRDEAVRVGGQAEYDYQLPAAEDAIRERNMDREKVLRMLRETSRDDAVRVLDAAHAAGLISYQDEWEQVATPPVPLGWRPRFVRRVSFEAGEEANEEPT